MFEIGRDIFSRGISGNSNNKTARVRLRVVYYVLVAMFALFAVRTLLLGIEGTDRSRLAGADGEWVASRADIVDRNGDILAKNIVSGHIMLRPPYVKNPDAVANAIHKAMPYEYPLAKALDLVNSNRRFM